MKKNLCLIFILILCILFTGCGKGNEKKKELEHNPDITKDVKSNISSDFTCEELTIESVEQIKRNFDPENKYDEIYVCVKGTCYTAKCEMQFKLVYNHYTEGGWILDEIQPINTEDWSAFPIAGIDSAILQPYMQEVADYGYSNENYFGYVEVGSRNFDESAAAEEITYILTTSTPFRELSAELGCTYNFVSYCENDCLSWHWERDYSKDNYTVISNDYSKLAGEWYENDMDYWEAKYNSGRRTIEQLSSDEFAINPFPGGTGYCDYIIFRMTGNNPQVIGLKHLDKSYQGVVNGSYVTLNSDGSIDYQGGFGSSGHLIKQ